jgi:hypothetical protein
VTPLAAKLFGLATPEMQRVLAASQFFECTSLTDLALEMRRQDPIESGASENARLPAPCSVLEALVKGARFVFVCEEQEDGTIAVNAFAAPRGGQVQRMWVAGFEPGAPQFRIEPGAREEAVFAGLLLVEKFLCMINQPGLVASRELRTDKRVLKLASSLGLKTAAVTWGTCYIRPGVHARRGEDAQSGREHKLHYVRRHRKPSLGEHRWVDGYWRGNADLGVHLKDYVVRPDESNSVT